MQSSQRSTGSVRCSLASAVVIIVVAGCGLLLLAGWIAGGVLRFASAKPDIEIAAPPSAPPARIAPRAAIGDRSDLPALYQAARQAMAIRFPRASGTIRISATLAPDGSVQRFDMHSDTLDPAVPQRVGDTLGTSAMRLANRSHQIALPDLVIPQSRDPA